MERARDRHRQRETGRQRQGDKDSKSGQTHSDREAERAKNVRARI